MTDINKFRSMGTEIKVPSHEHAITDENTDVCSTVSSWVLITVFPNTKPKETFYIPRASYNSMFTQAHGQYTFTPGSEAEFLCWATGLFINGADGVRRESEPHSLGRLFTYVATDIQASLGGDDLPWNFWGDIRCLVHDDGVKYLWGTSSD